MIGWIILPRGANAEIIASPRKQFAQHIHRSAWKK
jgi:hypothetical protein